MPHPTIHMNAIYLPYTVKNNPVVTRVYKKGGLYLTLVTLGPELCQLVLVWLITEVFVIYSTE